MRPASEIHSAKRLAEHYMSELDRAALADALGDDHAASDQSMSAASNMSLLYDVLCWVMGDSVDQEGQHAWLAGVLLDDPPKIDSTPPEVN